MEVPSNFYNIPLDKCHIIRDGDDVSIVSWGATASNLSKTVERLSKDGISCEVIDLQSLYPIDYETIFEVLSKIINLVSEKDGNSGDSI